MKENNIKWDYGSIQQKNTINGKYLDKTKKNFLQLKPTGGINNYLK